MSVIYRATDIALGRQVAVKILRPSLTSDPTFLTRFRQEARNVANLQHPNIVTVHDVGQDGNTHFIVMELIDGDDLKQRIRADAPFAIDRALDICIKICAGIGYAHRAGLVHADVKPQNVLLVESDNVKVTDFGIAQALAATNPQERQKVVWGSPHYFSPEQAQGKNPTTASDVYSIGVVLFEMLTGRLPFMGNDQQELALAHIRQPVPHIQEFNPQIPEQLDRIVQKVLAKEPNARYAQADQLGRILVNYRDQGLSKTSGQPSVPSTPPPSNAQPAVKSPFAPPDSPEYTQPKLAPAPDFTHAAQTLPGNRSVEATSPGQYTRPEYMRDSGYFTPVDPPTLDVVTILLAFIALLAVLGMVILWVFVFQAYT
jgi:serine/threonine-protein kinase